jgi:phospholipid/cholesterol/gamma-HCH transport system substrate-binding protein
MKREYRIGVFALISLAIIGFFVIKTENISGVFWKKKVYTIHAHFPSVAGMYTAAPVRLAGVKIGQVTDIRLTGRRAIVDMAIEEGIQLTEDGRAIISTVGFVGEKYVEIVYKEAFFMVNPRPIPPGGEIQVLEPFSLDELKTRIDVVYDRVLRLLDSVNDVVGDQQSKESLRTLFVNLGSVSERLRSLLADSGRVGSIIGSVEDASSTLSRVMSSIDRIVNRTGQAIGDDQQGLLADLRRAAAAIDKLAGDIRAISTDLRAGHGTAGKLLTDDSLYTQLSQSAEAISHVAQDLEKKSGSLKEMHTSLGVRADYFAKQEKARSVLELQLDMKRFTLVTTISEDPLSGRTRVTALGGRRFTSLTVSAGLFESRLGAALKLGLLKNKVQMELFASRFYGGHTPLLQALLTFSLGRNLYLQSGWYDLLRRDTRELVIGFGLRTSSR